MEFENIESFYAKLIASKQISEKLTDKLSKVQNRKEYEKFIEDDILPIAKANGYDFDVKDILLYDQKKFESLSEQELESITGGKINTLVTSIVSALVFILGVSAHSASAMVSDKQPGVVKQMTTTSDDNSAEVESLAKPTEMPVANLAQDRGPVAADAREYEDEVAPKLAKADGLVVGSPVYYGSPSGTIISFMDRLFYSTWNMSKHMKVGAAVVSCRRSGNTASFDVLNKYFTISSMPIASSTYWNNVHGFTADDVKKDLEGLQTVRNLARNMVFMIRAIAAEKEKSSYPEVEHNMFTSFPDGK